MSWLAVLLPATPERFAGWLVRALEAAGTTGFEYVPYANALVREGGQVIHLENLLAELLYTPRWRRPTAIRSLAAAFAMTGAPEPTFEEASADLVPRVRDRLFLELLALHAPGIEIPFEPLTEHFALSLAIDSPVSVRDVTRADLERWGKAFEELLPIAKHHLAVASDPPRFVDAGSGVLRSAWNDVYDASRVVLPGMLRSLGVRGKPVVTLPNRNTLLVTGSEDPSGLRALLRLTDEILESEPRPQSGRVLVVDGGSIEPFHTEEPSLRDALRRREILQYARDHAEQKAALEASFSRCGRDCFVATLSLTETPDGRLETSAAWVEGADDALLPCADLVVFVVGYPEPERCVYVPFEEVLQRLGHRMEPQGMVPERWHTTSFPTADELSGLPTVTDHEGADPRTEARTVQ